MLRVFGLLWARTVATQAKYKHVVELDFSKVDYMNNEVCNLFFSVSKFFIPNYSIHSICMLTSIHSFILDGCL